MIHTDTFFPPTKHQVNVHSSEHKESQAAKSTLNTVQLKEAIFIWLPQMPFIFLPCRILDILHFISQLRDFFLSILNVRNKFLRSSRHTAKQAADSGGPISHAAKMQHNSVLSHESPIPTNYSCILKCPQAHVLTARKLA